MSREPIPRHVAAGAVPLDVRHACPECPLGHGRPGCPVCAGTGLVTTDQLGRWQQSTDARIATTYTWRTADE
jgi:hypothetical protein